MYVCMYGWMDLCIYLKTSRYIYISFQYLNDDIKIYLYHKYKTYIYISKKRYRQKKTAHPTKLPAATRKHGTLGDFGGSHVKNDMKKIWGVLLNIIYDNHPNLQSGSAEVKLGEHLIHQRFLGEPPKNENTTSLA